MNEGKKSSRYIVVIGCGRLGSLVANTLSREGNSVVVIDSRESAFNALSLEFSGFKIQGDTTELAVLKQANIERADVLIVTTPKDNVNLMVAQEAKKIFQVGRVLARINDPRRTATYRALGIETVCPTTLSAEMFLQALTREGPETG